MHKSWSEISKIAMVFPFLRLVSVGCMKKTRNSLRVLTCTILTAIFKDLDIYMAGSMSRTIDRVMNKFAKVCLRVDPLETKVKDQGNCESSRCQAEDLPPALPSLNKIM